MPDKPSGTVLTNKIAALKRLSEAWGPHSEDGKLTAWAVREIERLASARLRDDSPAYDLPEALRQNHRQPCPCVECRAADEIDRLRARCDELERANVGLATESERLRSLLGGETCTWPNGRCCLLTVPLPKDGTCQHDRFKPGFTLDWLGSTPQLHANTHRFQCRICRETFDLAIAEAQLAERREVEPT